MIKNNKQQLFLIMKEAINSSKPDNKFPKLLDKSALILFAIAFFEKSPSFPKGTSLNKKNRI